MNIARWEMKDEYFVMPLSPTVLMTALGAFVLFRALGAAQGRARRGRPASIQRLSALSFGVYLVHPAVLTQIRDHTVYPPTVTGVSEHAGGILAATLAASVAITAVGRRIPGVRNVF